MAALEAKVVVLGSQGVGKTSLIQRYIGHIFAENTTPTIGASFCSCNIDIEDHRVKLLIWDTAGQERFRSMAPMYYRNANAAILMFDITSWHSYEDMQSWIEELKKNVQNPTVTCIVGNKSDINHIRAVPSQEAHQFATSIGALYHETSALNSKGVESVFVDIAKELLKQKLQSAAEDGHLIEREPFQEGKVIHLTKSVEQRKRKRSDDDEERSFLCC